MTIDEIRRHNLAQLISSYGTLTAFAAAIERSESQVSQWVNASLNSGTGKPRGMRSDSCRHIERMTGKPSGWMDQSHASSDQSIGITELAPAQLVSPPPGYVRLEHLSPTPSMGRGREVNAPVQLVQHLDVLEQWVREKVGSVNPSRIKVLTGSGNSMSPTINDGDLVFVDVECRSIEAAGIYVLDVAGRLILKKAMILSSGTLIIRSDNIDEYPDEERYDLRHIAEAITVCGKVMAWWSLRKG